MILTFFLACIDVNATVIRTCAEACGQLGVEQVTITSCSCQQSNHEKEPDMGKQTGAMFMPGEMVIIKKGNPFFSVTKPERTVSGVEEVDLKMVGFAKEDEVGLFISQSQDIVEVQIGDRTVNVIRTAVTRPPQ